MFSKLKKKTSRPASTKGSYSFDPAPQNTFDSPMANKKPLTFGTFLEDYEAPPGVGDGQQECAPEQENNEGGGHVETLKVARLNSTETNGTKQTQEQAKPMMRRKKRPPPAPPARHSSLNPGGESPAHHSSAPNVSASLPLTGSQPDLSTLEGGTPRSLRDVMKRARENTRKSILSESQRYSQEVVFDVPRSPKHSLFSLPPDSDQPHTTPPIPDNNSTGDWRHELLGEETNKESSMTFSTFRSGDSHNSPSRQEPEERSRSLDDLDRILLDFEQENDAFDDDDFTDDEDTGSNFDSGYCAEPPEHAQSINHIRFTETFPDSSIGAESAENTDPGFRRAPSAMSQASSAWNSVKDSDAESVNFYYCMPSGVNSHTQNWLLGNKEEKPTEDIKDSYIGGPPDNLQPVAPPSPEKQNEIIIPSNHVDEAQSDLLSESQAPSAVLPPSGNIGIKPPRGRGEKPKIPEKPANLRSRSNSGSRLSSSENPSPSSPAKNVIIQASSDRKAPPPPERPPSVPPRDTSNEANHANQSSTTTSVPSNSSCDNQPSVRSKIEAIQNKLISGSESPPQPSSCTSSPRGPRPLPETDLGAADDQNSRDPIDQDTKQQVKRSVSERANVEGETGDKRYGISHSSQHTHSATSESGHVNPGVMADYVPGNPKQNGLESSLLAIEELDSVLVQYEGSKPEEKAVREWDSQDIVQWCQAQGLQEMAEIFEDTVIDGESLFEIKQQDLDDLEINEEEQGRFLHSVMVLKEKEEAKGSGAMSNPSPTLQQELQQQKQTTESLERISADKNVESLLKELQEERLKNDKLLSLISRPSSRNGMPVNKLDVDDSNFIRNRQILQPSPHTTTQQNGATLPRSKGDVVMDPTLRKEVDDVSKDIMREISKPLKSEPTTPREEVKVKRTPPPKPLRSDKKKKAPTIPPVSHSPPRSKSPHSRSSSRERLGHSDEDELAFAGDDMMTVIDAGEEKMPVGASAEMYQHSSHRHQTALRDDFGAEEVRLEESLPKTPLETWDHSTVLNWLRLSGLNKFTESFKAYQVDGRILSRLNMELLDDLAVTSVEDREIFLSKLYEIQNPNAKKLKTKSDPPNFGLIHIWHNLSGGHSSTSLNVPEYTTSEEVVIKLLDLHHCNEHHSNFVIVEFTAKSRDKGRQLELQECPLLVQRCWSRDDAHKLELKFVGSSKPRSESLPQEVTPAPSDFACPPPAGFDDGKDNRSHEPPKAFKEDPVSRPRSRQGSRPSSRMKKEPLDPTRQDTVELQQELAVLKESISERDSVITTLRQETQKQIAKVKQNEELQRRLGDLERRYAQQEKYWVQRLENMQEDMKMTIVSSAMEDEQALESKVELLEAQAQTLAKQIHAQETNTKNFQKLLKQTQKSHRSDTEKTAEVEDLNEQLSLSNSKLLHLRERREDVLSMMEMTNQALKYHRRKGQNHASSQPLAEILANSGPKSVQCVQLSKSRDMLGLSWHRLGKHEIVLKDVPDGATTLKKGDSVLEMNRKLASQLSDQEVDDLFCDQRKTLTLVLLRHQRESCDSEELKTIKEDLSLTLMETEILTKENSDMATDLENWKDAFRKCEDDKIVAESKCRRLKDQVARGDAQWKKVKKIFSLMKTGTPDDNEVVPKMPSNKIEEEVTMILRDHFLETSRQKHYLDKLLGVVMEEAPQLLESVDRDVGIHEDSMLWKTLSEI